MTVIDLLVILSTISVGLQNGTEAFHRFLEIIQKATREGRTELTPEEVQQVVEYRHLREKELLAELEVASKNTG